VIVFSICVYQAFLYPVCCVLYSMLFYNILRIYIYMLIYLKLHAQEIFSKRFNLLTLSLAACITPCDLYFVNNVFMTLTPKRPVFSNHYLTNPVNNKLATGMGSLYLKGLYYIPIFISHTRILYLRIHRYPLFYNYITNIKVIICNIMLLANVDTEPMILKSFVMEAFDPNASMKMIITLYI